MAQAQVVECERCHRECRPGKGNPKALLMRKSTKGYCVDCAVTQFLMSVEPIATMLRERGTDVLLTGENPQVSEQFAEILRIGESDAHGDVIDWRRVVDNWHLPVKGLGRRRRRSARTRRST